MLVGILLFGVYPQFLFKVFDPAVTALVGASGSGRRDARIAARPGGATGVRPTIDWHAIAPELVLVVGINIVLLVDLFVAGAAEAGSPRRSPGSCCSAAALPLVTLAVVGDDARSMFDGGTWSTTSR